MKLFVSAPAVLVTLGVMLAAGSPAAASFASGKYFEDNATAECLATNVCRLKFAPLPAGLKVLITHVACQMFSSANGVVRLANFGVAKGQPTGLTRPQATVPVPSTGTGLTTTTAETSYLLFPGQVPAFEVDITVDGVIGLACQINGQRPSPI